MNATFQINLTFEQILSMVMQLPKKQKIKLSKALEPEVMDVKLTKLLKTFKTDELNLKTIDEEVETVRESINN